jgi:hydrogenase-4 membrane subunit HyfE
MVQCRWILCQTNDNWSATKIKSVLFLPVVNIVLYLVLTVLSRLPHIHNYMVNITEENAYYQYSNSIQLLRILKLIMSAVLTYIGFTTIQVALEHQSGLSPLFLVAFLISIFSVVSYFMYRMLRHVRHNKP